MTITLTFHLNYRLYFSFFKKNKKDEEQDKYSGDILKHQDHTTYRQLVKIKIKNPSTAHKGHHKHLFLLNIPKTPHKNPVIKTLSLTKKTPIKNASKYSLHSYFLVIKNAESLLINNLKRQIEIQIDN